MKLHVSVAALAAAAGAFAYGAQVRAQSVLTPGSSINGIVVPGGYDLTVGQSVTITNAEYANVDVVNLSGGGYGDRRDILVEGALKNYGDFNYQAISGTGLNFVADDASNNSVTITVASTGQVRTYGSAAKAIFLNNDVDVYNSGVIASVGRSVEVDQDLVLTNSGTISSQGQNAIHFGDNQYSEVHNTLSITNSGQIAGGSTGDVGVYVDDYSASTQVTITQTSGTISGAAGGVDIYGQNVDVTISGGPSVPMGAGAAAGDTVGFAGRISQTSYGASGPAIFVGAEYTATATIHVGQSGAVYAESGAGIVAYGRSVDATITNEGSVSSGVYSPYGPPAIYLGSRYGGAISISNAEGAAITSGGGDAIAIYSGGFRRLPFGFEGAGAPASTTISITNSGSITAGDFLIAPEGGPARVAPIYGPADAIDIYASNSVVNIDNDGDITAPDDAISVTGFNNSVTIDNSGDLTGGYGGVYVGNYAPPYGETGASQVTVVNSGSIAGGGVYEGEFGSDRYGVGVEVDVTLGYGLPPQAASDFPNYPGTTNIDVVNTGSVSGGEYGVLIDVYRGEYLIETGPELAGAAPRGPYANVVVTNGASGTITGGNGLYVYGGGDLGYVQVTNSGTITGEVEEGVLIGAYHAISVNVANTGSITSADDEAIEITDFNRYQYGPGAPIAPQYPNFGSITVSNAGSGLIQSTGSYEEAVDIEAYSVGVVSVSNADTGAILGGAEAVDISVLHADQISVANSGSATISGEYGVDISARNAGVVSVENSDGATISGTGDAIRFGGDAATVTVSSTGGAITSEYGAGVRIRTGSAASISIANGEGSSITGYRGGVNVSAFYSQYVGVSNAGSILSSGQSSYWFLGDNAGIAVQVAILQELVLDNSGDVTSTSGRGVQVGGGYGMKPRGPGLGEAPLPVETSITITNSGQITSAMDGVYVNAPYAQTIYVGNTGSIASSNAAGVNITNGRFLRFAAPRPAEDVPAEYAERPPREITVFNDGAIEAATFGVTTYGTVSSLTLNAPPAINVRYGPVTSNQTITNGPNGSIDAQTGVFAGGFSANNVAIVNDGAVTAERTAPAGEYGDAFGVGLAASGYVVAGSISIGNNGAVTASDTGVLSSVGVLAPGQSVTITNTGSVTGGDVGVGVEIGQVGLPLAPTGPALAEEAPLYSLADVTVSVENSGDISGGGAAGVTVTHGSILNSGSISGGAFGVTTTAGLGDYILNDGGSISGGVAVSTGAGDDRVVAKGAAVFIGDVDGGDDTDDLTLDGFSGPSFTPLNFETVGLINGTVLTLDDATNFQGDALSIDGSSSVVATGPNNGLTFDTITNAGLLTLQDGAADDVLTIRGPLTSTGTIAVDVDPQGGTQDLVDVTGGTADVSGGLNVALVSTPAGPSEHVVISADGGATDSGLVLNQSDTLVTQFALRNDPNDIVLVISTDFAPNGLFDDGSTFGAYLNANATDPALAPVLSLAQAAGSIEELQELYSNLNGVDFSQSVNSGLLGGMTFGGGLFSCAVGEGQFAAIDEGQCGWVRIGGSYYDRDRDGANPGVDETVLSISAGGQAIYDDNIRLGAGFGVDVFDSDGSGGTEIEGTRIHAGVSAKFVDGPMMAGVSLSAGYSFADSERTTALGVADGDFDTFDVTLMGKAAYLFDLGDGVYIKPEVKAAVTHVDRESFTETGAGAANLAVSSESDTYFSFAPAIEIGADLEVEDMKVRPYVRVGATILSEDDVQTTARLASAASPGTFTTTTDIGDVFGDVAAGVTIFSEDDLTIRAEYRGRFSDDTIEHGGFLKVQVNF